MSTLVPWTIGWWLLLGPPFSLLGELRWCYFICVFSTITFGVVWKVVLVVFVFLALILVLLVCLPISSYWNEHCSPRRSHWGGLWWMTVVAWRRFASSCNFSFWEFYWLCFSFVNRLLLVSSWFFLSHFNVLLIVLQDSTPFTSMFLEVLKEYFALLFVIDEVMWFFFIFDFLSPYWRLTTVHEFLSIFKFCFLLNLHLY